MQFFKDNKKFHSGGDIEKSQKSGFGEKSYDMLSEAGGRKSMHKMFDD